MTEKHLKKCSKSLVIREMQIKKKKKALTYHLTPVSVVKIKTSNNSTCWQGCEERGSQAHAFNPSTQEAEAGEFLSLRPAWSTK
jgi:hypothetical protein